MCVLREPARPFSVNRRPNTSEAESTSLTRNCSTLKTVSKVLIRSLIAAPARLPGCCSRSGVCAPRRESLPQYLRLTSVLWRPCRPDRPRLYLPPASLLTDRYDLVRAHFTHLGVLRKGSLKVQMLHHPGESEAFSSFILSPRTLLVPRIIQIWGDLHARAAEVTACITSCSKRGFKRGKPPLTAAGSGSHQDAAVGKRPIPPSKKVTLHKVFTRHFIVKLITQLSACTRLFFSSHQFSLTLVQLSFSQIFTFVVFTVCCHSRCRIHELSGDIYSHSVIRSG